MAEAIFVHKSRQLGLDTFVQADSAGTESYHVGSLPDRRTRQVCEERGIPLAHRGRKIGPKDFMEFDHIVVMDAVIHGQVSRMRPKEAKAQVSLMTDYRKKHPAEEVTDPYYGGMEGFYEIYEVLDDTSEGLLEHIRRTAIDK
jgi:protein-tyrosine-phosphatase